MPNHTNVWQANLPTTAQQLQALLAIRSAMSRSLQRSATMNLCWSETHFLPHACSASNFGELAKVSSWARNFQTKNPLWALLTRGFIPFAFLTTCSFCIAALISLDRVWTIVFPDHYQQKTTTSLAVKLLLIPWIVAFAVWGLPILLWYPISGEDRGSAETCFPPFRDNEKFMGFLGVMDFHIPFLTITVCNVVIAVVIIKRSNKFKISFVKDIRKFAKQKQDVKAARALAVLVLIFFFTWAPYEILSILDPICGTCVSRSLLWASYYLVWFNAAITPFVYPLMQKDIRTALKNLLCCGKSPVVPIPLDTPQVKRIIVHGYQDNIGNKLAIPEFMKRVKPKSSDDEAVNEKNHTSQPARKKPYYLRNLSRLTRNKVEPLTSLEPKERVNNVPSKQTRLNADSTKKRKSKQGKQTFQDFVSKEANAYYISTPRLARDQPGLGDRTSSYEWRWWSMHLQKCLRKDIFSWKTRDESSFLSVPRLLEFEIKPWSCTILYKRNSAQVLSYHFLVVPDFIVILFVQWLAMGTYIL